MRLEHGTPEGERGGEMAGGAPEAQAREGAARRQGEARHGDAADPFVSGPVEGEHRHLRARQRKALGDLSGRGGEPARRWRVVPGQEGGAHQAARRRW